MLDWQGDRVREDVERAAARAERRVIRRAIARAARDTPVETGAARDSLGIDETGTELRLEWGYHVPYGIFIEVGEQGRAGHHALRRAGDAEYPSLAGEIRSELGS